MNTIEIKGTKFSVLKEVCTLPSGTKYNQYTLKGPRATYYTARHVNIPGSYFLLDSSCKIATRYIGICIVEESDNCIRVQ